MHSDESGVQSIAYHPSRVQAVKQRRRASAHECWQKGQLGLVAATIHESSLRRRRVAALSSFLVEVVGRGRREALRR